MELEKLMQAFLTIIWLKRFRALIEAFRIAIPPENWSIFASFDQQQLASVLFDLAARVHLSSFLKQPRAPKKNIDPPTCDPRHRHVSTARLLADAKKSP